MFESQNRPLRVFICHSSQDKPILRDLYKRLKGEGWIEPWLDEEKLYPGQDWNLEIEKAVEAADAILVCLSKNSITKEGYIQRELRFVLEIADYKPEGTLFIIPVRLDDCEPPRRLRAWQYANYFPKEDRDQAYKRLLVSLRMRAEWLGISTKNAVEERNRLEATDKSEKEQDAQNWLATEEKAPLEMPERAKSGQKEQKRISAEAKARPKLLYFFRPAIIFGSLGGIFVKALFCTSLVANSTFQNWLFGATNTPSLQPTEPTRNEETPSHQPIETSNTVAQVFFNEEFEIDSGNWSSYTVRDSNNSNEDGFNIAIDNSNMIFDISSKYLYAYVLYDPYNYRDVEVEARVKNVGTNNNNISLICRYSTKGWYEFNISNNGLYNIYAAMNNTSGDIVYNFLADGGSNKIKSGKEINEYKIICRDRKLAMYINGFETRSLEDNKYVLRDGQIGISVSSFADLPVKVEVDWIKISEP